MTDPVQRITDEFRRLDDELSAAVTLPQVDSVISRAGALNRASTAAAAAVITVGALGGVTVMAQAAAPQTTAGAQDATVRPAAPGGQPLGVGFAPAPESETEAPSVAPETETGDAVTRARVRPDTAEPDVTSAVPLPPPPVLLPPPPVEEPTTTTVPRDPGTGKPTTKTFPKPPQTGTTSKEPPSTTKNPPLPTSTATASSSPPTGGDAAPLDAPSDPSAAGVV